MNGHLRGVLLAAGNGVRLMPLTARRPKPMLPIAGKPLLEYNLEQLAATGAHEVAIVISPRGEAIQRHFGDHWHGMALHFVVQAEAGGTGRAVQLTRELVDGQTFLCIFGDNLTTWPMARLLLLHDTAGAAATLALFHADDPRRHGVAEVDGRRVRRIIEKPDAPRSDLASAGMFVLEPGIFDALEATKPAPGGELQLPDALQVLISRGRTVAYAELNEWRTNVNTPQELLGANRQMLTRITRPAAGDAIRPPVALADEPAVARGAVLGPYVSCGRRCTIEAGARVSDSVLLDDVTIGPGAQVERAIIGEGARVEPGACVCDQVVADDACCG